MQTEIKKSELPLPGAPLPGGYYAGTILCLSAQYAIIVAPAAHDFNSAWQDEYTKIPGADSTFDGHTNTQAMLAAGLEIAKAVTSLVIDDHADFYIPARDELEIIYRNLKPTDGENFTGPRNGENPSASSQIDRQRYLTTAPAQTTVEAFQEGGEQAMQARWYWTSTQCSAGYAWTQVFSDGYQYVVSKDGKLAARAVRRMLIIE